MVSATGIFILYGLYKRIYVNISLLCGLIPILVELVDHTPSRARWPYHHRERARYPQKADTSKTKRVGPSA
eukprot:6213329-Pleurochrysis_carterae.AAC.1